jgi:hypothetical protein
MFGVIGNKNKGINVNRRSLKKEYYSWMMMIQRCHNPKSPKYHSYGQRGITVCDDWRYSFDKFYGDMGPMPTPKHTLDRINNNEGYNPGNCRWATMAEQANNKRNNIMITHNGETKTLGQWCKDLGLRYSLIYSRVRNHGKPFTEAITL